MGIKSQIQASREKSALTDPIDKPEKIVYTEREQRTVEHLKNERRHLLGLLEGNQKALQQLGVKI